MEQPRIADVVQEDDDLIPAGFVHIEGRGGFKKGEILIIGSGGKSTMNNVRMAMLIAAAGMASPVVIDDIDTINLDVKNSLRNAFDGLIAPVEATDIDFPDPKHPAVKAEERRKNILGPKRGRW